MSTSPTTPLRPSDERRLLYDRIMQFTIDEGDPELTFECRLARENGWSVSYAKHVIEEYKRFIFLAMVAGHPVTPSDQVDQAWHLHLTYTRSYWERLCGELLPRALHHGPTKGGTVEAAKYDDWYRRTLVSYEGFFGVAPPEDIWPDTSVRFGEDLHFRRVNTKRYWVVSKPSQLLKQSFTVGFTCIGILAITYFLRPTFAIAPAYWIVPTVLCGTIAIVFLMKLWLRRRISKCSKCGKRTMTPTGEHRMTHKGLRTEKQCKNCGSKKWHLAGGGAAATDAGTGWFGMCGGCGDAGCGSCSGGCGGGGCGS